MNTCFGIARIHGGVFWAIDSALIEMCHLRSLDPPSPESVNHLRKELQKMSAQSFLPSDAIECWDPVNDDDLVEVRSGVGKGNRLNIWLKLGLEIFKWELWGRRKVCLKPTPPPFLPNTPGI